MTTKEDIEAAWVWLDGVSERCCHSRVVPQCPRCANVRTVIAAARELTAERAKREQVERELQETRALAWSMGERAWHAKLFGIAANNLDAQHVHELAVALVAKEQAEKALRDVVAHTAYRPACERDILEGLLASCDRIARAALGANETIKGSGE